MCKHAEAHWEMATNEDGWRCDLCSAKLGFRPDFDEKWIEAKADAVLSVLHLNDLAYVSNQTQAEIIVHNVAKAARKAGRFDQHTLTALILADPNLDNHATYWATEAARWLEVERAGGSHEKPVDQQLRAAGTPSLFDALAF